MHAEFTRVNDTCTESVEATRKVAADLDTYRKQVLPEVGSLRYELNSNRVGRLRAEEKLKEAEKKLRESEGKLE